MSDDLQAIVRGLPAWIPRTCEVCGANFEAPRHRVLAGRGRTCSRPCAGKKAGEAFATSRPKPTDSEIVAYLWANVRVGGPDECWPWARTASTTAGRGILSFRGFRALAYRVAYRGKTGEWPPDDMMVCHSCDNPACCNPAHLWLGTNADNMRDVMEKRRINPRPINRGKRARKTHCKRGHEFNAENTVKNTYPGSLKCKICLAFQRKARRRGISIDDYLRGQTHG